MTRLFYILAAKKALSSIFVALNFFILAFLTFRNPILLNVSLLYNLNLFFTVSFHLLYTVSNIIKDYSTDIGFNFMITLFVSSTFCTILFLMLI